MSEILYWCEHCRSIHALPRCVPAESAQASCSEAKRNADGLLPCPFCGSEVSLKPGKEKEHIRFIMCPDDSPCRHTGLVQAIDARKLDEGIDAWNRRSPLNAEAERP